MTNAGKVQAKLTRKMPLGGIRRKYENTEIYFGEVVHKNVKWNNLAQKGALCPTFVIMATKFLDS